MQHKIAEFDFFERGLALVIASLDGANEILATLDEEKSHELTNLIDGFIDVEEYEGWKHLDQKLKDFSDQFLQEPAYLNNKELHYLLTEPVYLNKYLDLLLTGFNYQDVRLDKAEEILKANFSTMMQALLAFPDIKEVFSEEILKVIKILVSEEDEQDLAEGFMLVFAEANNRLASLAGPSLEIFNLVTEADALLSYLAFLTAGDEEE